MLRKGDTPVAGYKLVNFLGRGQYGEVWEAIAPGGTEVALKFISLLSHSGDVELKALRAVKLIRHPNLISINAVWVLDEEGNVIPDESLAENESKPSIDTVSPNETLVPESVETGAWVESPKPAMLVIAMVKADMSLEDRLKQAVTEEDEPGVPVGELLEYMDQAATGIDFLNEERHLIDGVQRGVIHRDIKPANLLMVGNAVVVGDFGVATTLRDFDATATSLSGSIGFMSPESIARRPSTKTDQYALAISYYWLRTNALPYAKTVSMDKLMEIHRTGALDFDFVGPDERAILKKATSSDPKERFANCREMVGALRLLHSDVVMPVSSSSTNSAWVWASVGGAAVLLIALGYFFFFSGTQRNELAKSFELAQGAEVGNTAGALIEEKTLRLLPADATFEVDYRFADQEVRPEVSSGQVKIRLGKDETVNISAEPSSPVYRPLASGEYSAKDLEQRNWTIQLEEKSYAELRKEFLEMLRKDSGETNGFLEAVLPEFDNLLDYAELHQELTVLGSVDGMLAVRVSGASAGSASNGPSKIGVIQRIKTPNGSNTTAQLVAANTQTLTTQPGPVLDATGRLEQWFFDAVGNQFVAVFTNTILVWKLGDERVEPIKLEDDFDLTCASFQPESGLLAAGDFRGNIAIWNLRQGEDSSKRIDKVHGEDGVQKLFFGEKNLLSVSSSGEVALIEIEGGVPGTPRPIRLPVDDSKLEFGVVAIPSGLSGVVLAAGNELLFCRSFDISQPGFFKLGTLGVREEVQLMKVSADARWLAMQTDDSQNAFKLWDLKNTENKFEYKFNSQKPDLSDISFSVDSRWAALAFNDGSLLVLDLNREGEGRVAQFDKLEGERRSQVVFSSDSRFLVTAVDSEDMPRLESFLLPESYELSKLKAARSAEK